MCNYDITECEDAWTCIRLRIYSAYLINFILRHCDASNSPKISKSMVRDEGTHRKQAPRRKQKTTRPFIWVAINAVTSLMSYIELKRKLRFSNPTLNSTSREWLKWNGTNLDSSSEHIFRLRAHSLKRFCKYDHAIKRYVNCFPWK